MTSQLTSKPFTRRDRIIRIAIGALLMVLNGASFGRWYDPFVGEALAGALWMGLGVILTLYVVYHFVQLIRQSKADQ